MGDSGHFALLKSGVDLWNLWRVQQPDVFPDLSACDLSINDLSEANLSGTNLTGANLSNADLCEAILGCPNIVEFDSVRNNPVLLKAVRAGFPESCFREADLSGANGSYADFSGAYLRATNLRSAFLGRAILRQCCLNDANLEQTIIRGADLTGSNGRVL